MGRLVGVFEDTGTRRHAKHASGREEDVAVNGIVGVGAVWNVAPASLSFLTGAGHTACHTRQASPFERGDIGPEPPPGDALRYFSRRR